MIYLNDRFIGREKEMGVLESAYMSHAFELVTVSGASGTGKTALIRGFCEGRRAVLFTASRTNRQQNLSAFSKAVSKAMYKGLRSLVDFASLPEAIVFLRKLSEKERLIVVIDRYDDLIACDPSSDRMLREMFVHDLQGANMMVIISSSAPLDPIAEGQRDIVLADLSFQDFRDAFYDSFDDHSLMMLYSVTGGRPEYVRYIDPDRSAEENVDAMCLRPDAPLFREPVARFMASVRNPEQYLCILSALAEGPLQMGEIVERSGVTPSSACSTYLASLISMGVVEKSVPWGEKASRKGQYKICDGALLFWMRFVHGNESLIEYRYGEDLYDLVISDEDGHLAQVFRDVCLQFIHSNPAFFDMMPSRYGEWWGDAGHIDIIASDLLTTMFCDCRYRDSPVGKSVLDSLISKSRSIRTIGTRRYALFSKSGFTKELRDHAERNPGITLVSLRDICRF
jgi:AAA+ ATPase superfamily predicted ATPase